MDDDNFKHVLRQMAWERATGQLRSMLVTYIGEQEKFAAMSDAIDEFITRVEEHGWQE